MKGDLKGRLPGGVKSGPARVCSEFRKWGAGVKKKDTHSCLWGTHVQKEETETEIQLLINIPFYFKEIWAVYSKTCKSEGSV